jgi:hypothetical protein
MALLNTTGTMSFGIYWRYAMLLFMLSTEMYLLFTPDDIKIFGFDICSGNWTRHDYITLLHDIGVALFIAMSQVLYIEITLNRIGWAAHMGRSDCRRYQYECAQDPQDY